MYFRGIAADSKFQEKMKGYLFSEGYLFTGFYGIAVPKFYFSEIALSLIRVAYRVEVKYAIVL